MSKAQTKADLRKEINHLDSRIQLLEADNRALRLVLASMNEVVRFKWRRGEVCPFCQGIQKHRDSCYLYPETGQQLLSEYASVEAERDRLSAIARRDADVPSKSIRSRFRP